MTTSAAVSVTVLYDYPRPYCYVGLVRLDMLAKELAFEIDRRPYLLRPDRPLEGEPRRLFDGETETDLNPAMQERAKGVGLVMRRPQWSPNTMRVHESTLFAKERGKDGQFHHLAAAACWESGADLNDLDVLKGIVEDAGLDRGDLVRGSSPGTTMTP